MSTTRPKINTGTNLDLYDYMNSGTLTEPAGRLALATALIDGPEDFTDQVLFQCKEWDVHILDRPNNKPRAVFEMLLESRYESLDYVSNQSGERGKAIAWMFVVLAFATSRELYKTSEDLLTWEERCKADAIAS